MKLRMRRSCGSFSARTALVRISCALLGVFLSALSLPAQTLSEYDVEAAYLYNFGKFVRWTAGTANSAPSFDICIMGEDPFGGTLDKLIADDRVGGRPIRKRLIGRASESEGCAIVYIGDSEGRHLRGILAEFNGKRQLLVSGLPHFMDDGGMVQFVVQGDRVRFGVNLEAASRCGLTFSSELLKVAVKVIGKPRNGMVR